MGCHNCSKRTILVERGNGAESQTFQFVSDGHSQFFSTAVMGLKPVAAWSSAHEAELEMRTDGVWVDAPAGTYVYVKAMAI